MIHGLTNQHSRIFHNFNALTEIPRCSGEEQGISDFLKQWAEERNLEVHQDKTLNIIIKKPASPGYENRETVVLQGHMDMVCEVQKGHEMNFSCDAIQAEIEDDFIIAKNTTLGADNGIAIAMIMTLFEDEKTVHGPLEALITVDEERGMTGAIHLEPQYISGRRLINIDSEDEGICCVGCAGGQRNLVTLKKDFVDATKDQLVEIHIEGLTGGHSGQDIHLQRANGNITLARVLENLKTEIEYELIDFYGGSKSNAIPRDAVATIAIDAKNANTLESILEEWVATLRKEYEISDKEVSLRLEVLKEKPEKAIVPETRDNLLYYLNTAPNGVVSMNLSIPGQVESSNNIGVVESESDKWSITSQVRSSLESKLIEIANRNRLIAERSGATFIADDAYPAWEYVSESKLRDVAQKVWYNMTNEELKLETIHAGLECGLLQDVIGEMDMISIGPDMSGVHAPGEKVSISSTDKVFNYLKELLKEL
ncbi:aminoacyl-histidine dipeptidase [Peptoniphilus sp. KCTC 25270]|uniref:aminoacyl-histidine dipeptidase n=1 Tax=Peptoniphilus sp. KCTC 25270 TaxID=2897414 RepID=UPI001E31AE62|nr:aminoacyl-histidine dipeptidase [Peptoniphilus sp. KCTC 25270]MCD1146954.1 aminoacyl-histidine dipeptidase [Peptoniphilus sp. KCTC 25270]